ncbi:MAG: hypothetical protein J6A46_00705, partial [Clostridia bacterium]|nr:hypothetical protein [Clostridia bacterium]
MVKYIVKRILISLLILLGVSVFLYFMIRLMPVNFIRDNYQKTHANSYDEAQLQELLKMYGLHDNSFP